ncbi:MAG: sugar-binding domain-containing protein [Bacteroidales bacterium]|jgi:beta-mannosidase
MKKVLPIFLIIILSINAFSQKNDYKGSILYIGSKSLLEEKGLLYIDNYDNPTKMFIGTNEKKYSFLDTISWCYSKDFLVNSEILKSKNINIFIEDIIGYAKLYLNDKLVLETNNGFISHKVDVSEFLIKGNNKLRIDFTPISSSLNYDNNKYNTLASEKRVINRFPQYLFGWDWYPKMLYPSFGHLDINSYDLSFEDYNVQTLKIENDTAYMLLNIGENKHYFQIAKPILWWPNGMGDTYIYSIRTIDIGYNKIDKYIQFGIKTIELIQEKDTIGQSFYFKINGKPMFVKGANYIHQSVSNLDEIKLAKKSGINMLRIWGGSNYGDDDFYNKCDELGILVWQDFPFACALYPADSSFLENVKQEAIQNVKRIAKHPSLALWCGNNEIWEGWNNWGWKQEVKDTIKAVENYNKLFKELLPNIVKEYTPTINYIHTSPLHGWGEKESLTHVIVIIGEFGGQILHLKPIQEKSHAL